MPFTIFTDSRGQSHSIYMQEKNNSCGIACIATVLNLTYGNNSFDESHLRLLSQQFPNGYKPHPMDVNANQRTFIAELIEQRQASGLLGSSLKLHSNRRPGMRSDAIAKTLASYNIYADKSVLNEIYSANKNDYVEKLKSKIIVLGIKNTNQCDHCIIIRDIWEDGTFIIYDPAIGLVETKDIEKHYDLFPYSNLLNCSYAALNNITKNLDLESGCMEPNSTEVLATEYQTSSRFCTLI
ncbi:hypothetical protein [Legionella brunensis]|nr:hypothetical protein [Legionella brunensis]